MIRKKKLAVIGAILMSASIILGALGAHTFSKIFDQDQLHSFDTATEYITIHGLAFLILSLIRADIAWATKILFYGLIAFSGSIYVFTFLSLAKIQVSLFGLITPLGGLMMIIGWIWISYALTKSKEHKSSGK